MIYQQPVREEYSHLACPTLTIVADKDDTVPFSTYASPEQRSKMSHFVELAEAAAKEIPNGRSEIVGEVGQVLHIEKPEEFHGILIDFLNEGK